MLMFQSVRVFGKNEKLKTPYLHMAGEILIDGFPLCFSQSVESNIFGYLYQ